MTGLRGRTAPIFLSQTAVQISGVAVAVCARAIINAGKGAACFAKKLPSMRMGPKLVPLFGIWLNCAVPASVSKVFLVMEVLGRATVKMVDPGLNCGSLDRL